MEKRITKNQIELVKADTESDKILVAKVDCLIAVLEAVTPDPDNKFSEYTRYTTIWDEIDSGIVKQKIIELIRKF